MIKNVQKYVDFLFEELHLTNEVLGVLLYGSYVLNEEDEFSDLDILIIVEENNKNLCGRGNIIKDSIPIEYFISLSFSSSIPIILLSNSVFIRFPSMS